MGNNFLFKTHINASKLKTVELNDFSNSSAKN